MRTFILLLDSFGVGAAPDAHQYGEEDADTFGHIWEHQQGFAIPNLLRLGLGHLAHLSTGKHLQGIDLTQTPQALWGCAAEKSLGKDTPSGHWEIAGVPVMFEWGYFAQTGDAFPPELIQRLIDEARLPGILGNKAASGTTIIDEFGEEHKRTGKPILYTSGDSVFQIAAHEETFGLQRLYEVCEIARRLVNEYNIGRVIARPFIGEKNHFKRTGNRKDLSVLPPSKTLLDRLVDAGREVIAIGKVAGGIKKPLASNAQTSKRSLLFDIRFA